MIITHGTMFGKPVNFVCDGKLEGSVGVIYKLLVALWICIVLGCSASCKEEPMCFGECQCRNGCATLHEPFLHYNYERIFFSQDVEDCWCIKDGAPHRIW